MDWLDLYLNSLNDIKNYNFPPDKFTWKPIKPTKQQQSLIEDSIVNDLKIQRLIQESRFKEEQAPDPSIGYDSGEGKQNVISLSPIPTPTLTITPTPEPSITPTPSPTPTVAPNSIANLDTQYDSSNGLNFVPSNPGDGDTFTQWNDSSGNAHNANAIGGASNRPSYQNGLGDTLNGFGVVRFDGSNDGLSINPYSSLVSKPGVTIISLFKMNGETLSLNNNDPRVFSTNISNGLALRYNSTSNLWAVAASSGVGESPITNDPEQFNIHAFIYDGSLTGNSNRLKYRYNGVEQTLSFTGTVGTTTDAGINTLYIGNNNSNNFFGGDIAEILIFTRALTTSEIEQMEAYLSGKWGV